MMLCVLLALVASAASVEADLTEGCALFMDCISRAQAAMDSCGPLREQMDMVQVEFDSKYPSDEPLSDKEARKKCLTEANDLSARHERARFQMDREYAVCLTERRSLAEKEGLMMAEDEERKMRKCPAVLDAYKASVSDAAKDDAKEAKKREKRSLRQKRCSDRQWRTKQSSRKDLQVRKRDFNQCKKRADRMKNECKALTNCCSESVVCHLKYEVSDVHDVMKALQLERIFKRRECAGIGVLNDLDVAGTDQVVENAVQS